MFDVWLAQWEVGCCRGLARPGDPWETILTFDGETKPAAGEELQRLDGGKVRFAGPVVRRVDDEPCHFSVVRAGPVLVVVEGETGIGRFLGGTGRLLEENHARYTEDALFTRGVVRRVWVVPALFDRSDATHRPVFQGYGEPLELTDAVRAVLRVDDYWEVRLEVDVLPRTPSSS